MKNVLIIGASGNFGGALLRALQRRPELHLRVLQRPNSPVQLPPGIELVRGDATQLADLRRACEGIDTVIYGLHLGYLSWRETLLPAALAMAQVAEERGLRIVYPGNVYGLGPDFSKPLSETCSLDAPREKGRVRNEIEARWQEATGRGARALIVRAGDFFGPGSRGTWLDHLVPASGVAPSTPTRKPVVHAWAYLPDLAETVVRLLERDSELAPFELFHFRGHEATPLEFMQVCAEMLGHRKVRSFPWWALRLGAWASPLFRELLKMRYLWDTPIRLEQRKLESFLGKVPHTPWEMALRATLER